MASLAVSAMAESDPSSALTQARQMPAGPKRDQAIADVAGKMVETDPAQALKLIQSLPNGTGTYEVFTSWAEKDPAQATQALLQLPVQRRNQAANAIASILVEKDPQSAVAWLNQLPAGQAS